MRELQPGRVWDALIVAIAGGFLVTCAGIMGDLRQAGYVDGCESGFVDAHRGDMYWKDENLFRNDTDYREGWENGYAYCYEDGSRYFLGGPGGGG